MLEIKNLTYTVTDEKTGKQIKILDDVSVNINERFLISNIYLCFLLSLKRLGRGHLCLILFYHILLIKSIENKKKIEFLPL